MSDPRHITAADLDEILSARDERVRRLIDDRLAHWIGNGGGAAFRAIVEDVMAEPIETVAQTRRALWGEPQLYAGLIEQHASLATEVTQLRKLLEQARTLLGAARFVLPLVGLGGLAQIVGYLSSLGS